MSSSNYFQALLGPNFIESRKKFVTLPDIDGATLKSIINFCYTGKIKITDENITQIVSAASAMELVCIEKKCKQFWKENLTRYNCVHIFLSADKFSFLDLRQKSLDFIGEHFEALAISGLQNLEFPYFAELLKCDEIHSREELIFQHLEQWIDYDDKNRLKYGQRLFKLIRLGKITRPVRFYDKIHVAQT